jgi:hypothetical protein
MDGFVGDTFVMLARAHDYRLFSGVFRFIYHPQESPKLAYNKEKESINKCSDF